LLIATKNFQVLDLELVVEDEGENRIRSGGSDDEVVVNGL